MLADPDRMRIVGYVVGAVVMLAGLILTLSLGAWFNNLISGLLHAL